MDRAVIYSRVSSTEQVGNLSLPTQEKLCREHCEKNGWEVVRVFVEPGESAKTANRPVFQEALNFCRQRRNGIAYLVVHSLSRFSRNTEDHVVVAATLRKVGVKLRSASEPIDDSYIGRFMETVLAGFAELDNRMKAERSIAGMKSALEIGRWPFRAPLGYLNVSDPAGKPTINIDPQRGSLIQQAFLRFSTGLYTQAQVLKDLHAQGLRTVKGDKISIQMFAYILRNRFYTGLLTVNRWGERKRGTFETLVDQDTFDKVQAILAGRRHKVTPFKRNRPDFPLRGLIKCGKCGALMTASWSTGRSKRYPYYRCWKKCRGMSIRADKIEGQFLELLNKLQMQENLISLFGQIVLDVWHDRQAHTRELAAANQRRLAELEGQRQRLLDVFIYKQAIDQETFQEQMNKLEAGISSLRIKANDGQTDDLDIERVVQFAQGVVSNAIQFWQVSPLDQKQRFQRVLCPEGIAVTEQGIVGTPQTSPIFSLVQMVSTDKSDLASLIVSSWNQIVAWLRQMSQLREAMAMAA